MAKSKKSSNAYRTKYLYFWETHPNYTALVHVVLGLGLGLLTQGYLETGYVNTLGWLLVFVGMLGHLYPLAI